MMQAKKTNKVRQVLGCGKLSYSYVTLKHFKYILTMTPHFFLSLPFFEWLRWRFPLRADSQRMPSTLIASSCTSCCVSQCPHPHARQPQRQPQWRAGVLLLSHILPATSSIWKRSQAKPLAEERPGLFSRVTAPVGLQQEQRHLAALHVHMFRYQLHFGQVKTDENSVAFHSDFISLRRVFFFLNKNKKNLNMIIETWKKIKKMQQQQQQIWKRIRLKPIIII